MSRTLDHTHSLITSQHTTCLMINTSSCALYPLSPLIYTPYSYIYIQYICMYVCMYVCIWVWSIFIYSIYVCMYVCMYMSMEYIYIQYICMYVCMYMSMEYIYIQYICMYVCMYMSMEYIYIQYICMYVYEYGVYLYTVYTSDCYRDSWPKMKVLSLITPPHVVPNQ